MKHNKITIALHQKGYTVDEFLKLIRHSHDWYYKHSNGGKSYKLLSLAVDGLTSKISKKSDIDLKTNLYFTPEQIREIINEVNKGIK